MARKGRLTPPLWLLPVPAKIQIIHQTHLCLLNKNADIVNSKCSPVKDCVHVKKKLVKSLYENIDEKRKLCMFFQRVQHRNLMYEKKEKKTPLSKKNENRFDCASIE